MGHATFHDRRVGALYELSVSHNFLLDTVSEIL